MAAYARQAKDTGMKLRDGGSARGDLSTPGIEPPSLAEIGLTLVSQALPVDFDRPAGARVSEGGPMRNRSKVREARNTTWIVRRWKAALAAKTGVL